MTALALTLLLLGAAVATRGLIGRQVGDEPRCRKCKYNLTGVESKECPECGRPWTPETAAKGLRFRHRRSLGFGTTLLLVGALLLTPAAQRKVGGVNWFVYVPTDWVITAAKRGSTDALSVLLKRHARSKLSPEQLQSMIESGLAVQSHPLLLTNAQGWMDFLGRLCDRRVLSKDQTQRFLEHMLTSTINVRRRIRLLDQLPFDCETVMRVPSSAVFAKVIIESLQVDGRPVTFLGSDRAEWLPVVGCGSEHARFGVAPTTFSPGTHRLTFTIRTIVDAAAGNYNSTSDLDYDHRVPFSTEFEVTSEDSIVVDSDPQTASHLAQIIDVTAILFPQSAIAVPTPSYSTAAGSLSLAFTLSEPSPIDGVFESLVLVSNGDAVYLGEFSLTKGDRTVRQFRPESARNGLPSMFAPRIAAGDFIRIQLRFRREYAYETTNITRTWDGYFIIGPIQVQLATAGLASQPATTAGS